MGRYDGPSEAPDAETDFNPSVEAEEAEEATEVGGGPTVDPPSDITAAPNVDE